MPQKLNKAGKMQDYIPAGNGDPSGEYGTSKGTNKNFTASDKKKTQANVITENKSVAVGDKKETKKDFWKEKIDKLEKEIDGYTKADKEGNKKVIEGLEKNLQDARFNKDLVDAYRELEELEKANTDGSLDSMIEEKKNEMKSIEENYKEWKKTGLNVAQQENRDKENARKTQANIIDDDLTGKKEKAYDGSDYKSMTKEETQKVIDKLEKAGFKKDKNYSGGRTYEIFDKDTGNYNSISVSEDGKMFVATINRQVYTYDDLETAIDRATYKSGKTPYDKAIGWENGSYNIEKENEFRKKHIKLD